MAIMYSYCFYFSVRLGSLIIGVYAMFRHFILTILAILWVNTPTESTRKFLKHYIEDQNLLFISDQAKIINKDPTLHSYIFLGVFSLHLLSTFGELYGSYYCFKSWLLPFIVLELWFLIFVTFAFITLMMLIKENGQDLGLLIGATLTGSFSLLFFFYSWACVLALYQCLKELGIEGPPEEQNTFKEPTDSLYQRPRARQDILLNIDTVRRFYPRYPSYDAPIYPQPAGYGHLIAPIY